MNTFAFLQIVIPFIFAVTAALLQRTNLKVTFLTFSIILMYLFRMLALKWCDNHLELENQVNYCALSPFFGILFLLSTFFIIIIFSKLKKLSDESF